MINRKKQLPIHKIKLFYISGLLLFFAAMLSILPACGSPKVHREPEPGNFYYSLKIKVNLELLDSGRKQGIKILLKFSGCKARMLFLGPPLNKIYAKMIVDGESALLINHKKKKYWRGNFKTLLREMWDMDFNYREFKELLLEGAFPAKRAKESGLEISVEKDNKSGRPGKIRIKGKQARLDLKISNHKTREGKIVFSVNLGRMEQAALESVLQGGE